jgi:hypothetical protein
MSRKGCKDCGEVFASEAELEAASRAGACVGAIVPLPRAADVLAFKLTHAGRSDEAAVVQERRPA